MDEDILDQVRAITADQLGVAERGIREDSDFVRDLHADSLDVVELVMSFEETFQLEIPDDALQGIRTVGDAVGYLRAALRP